MEPREGRMFCQPRFGKVARIRNTDQGHGHNDQGHGVGTSSFYPPGRFWCTSRFQPRRRETRAFIPSWAGTSLTKTTVRITSVVALHSRTGYRVDASPRRLSNFQLRVCNRGILPLRRTREYIVVVRFPALILESRCSITRAG